LAGFLGDILNQLECGGAGVKNSLARYVENIQPKKWPSISDQPFKGFISKILRIDSQTNSKN
jgi:hypothetical protein